MICFEKAFQLCIAGVNFRFNHATGQFRLALEQFYEHFVVPCDIAPDIVIEVKHGTSDFLKNTRQVFSAEFEHGLLEKIQYRWAIFQPGYCMACYTDKNEQIPYVTCLPGKDNEPWQIQVQTPRIISGNCCLEPLPYPLGPLIMYHYFTHHNAVMLHASGIFDQVTQKGFVFSAVSGTGKTTMSQLWAEKGCTVINDDRLILKAENEKITMYNNPLYIKDIPRSTPVSAIFLIHQAPVHQIRRIEGVSAFAGLMAFCIQHHYDKIMMELLTGTLIQIIDKVPVYELGFALNSNIVDYVRNNI